MAYEFLVKKTSTCKKLDIEYLDETSESKISALVGRDGWSEEKARSRADGIVASVDYLSKDDLGRVFAGGFLRDRLLERQYKAPESWDNTQRKRALKEEITRLVARHGTYRGNVGHRLVFSVSDQLQERMEHAGLNLDFVLGNEVKKILSAFQRKFHYGDKIGFAYGIHHDTDHRHAHVFLCNRTEKGQHVAFSNPLKGRHDPKCRKDQIGFVKDQVRKAQERMEQLTEKAEKDIALVPLKAISASNHTQKENKQRMRSPKAFTLRSRDDRYIDALRRKVDSLRREFEARRAVAQNGYGRWVVVNESMARGYKSIKELNNELKPLYEQVKNGKSTVPHPFLRKHIFPRGPFGSFARSVHRIMTARRREEREKLFKAIDARKHGKARIMENVEHAKKLRDEFKHAWDLSRKLRDDVGREFHRELAKLNRETERKEIVDFLNRGGSAELSQRYVRTLKSIKEKRAAGQSIDAETQFLGRLLSLSKMARSKPVAEHDRIRRFLASEGSGVVAGGLNLNEATHQSKNPKRGIHI